MSLLDMRPVRDAIGVVLFLLFLAFLVVGVARCRPAEQPGDLPPYCYSEERYTAKILLCVEASKTLAESKMCRQSVDYDCGIRQTTRAK